MKDRFKRLKKLFLRDKNFVFFSFLFFFFLIFNFLSCKSNDSSVKNPSDIAIELASLYRQEDDYSSSIKVLESFIKEYSKSYDARVNYNLAATYFVSDRADDALSLCWESFEIFPAHTKFLKLMVKIYQSQNDKENEKKILLKLLDLSSLESTEILSLYNLLKDKEKKGEEAGKILELIINKAELWTRQILNIAIEIAKENEKEELLVELDKMINYAKDDQKILDEEQKKKQEEEKKSIKEDTSIKENVKEEQVNEDEQTELQENTDISKQE